MRLIHSVPLVLALTASAQNEVPLASAEVFAHNMVLQRAMEVPVWGTARPGATVSVAFAGQSVDTVADATTGVWSLRLAPLEASTEPRELRIVATSDIPQLVFTNVVVGEVWLCSGQSNMAGLLGDHPQARDDSFPLIRQFTKSGRAKKQVRQDGCWAMADPTEREGFTSTGYFFARALHRELGVPVGILREAVSGSLIEPWIPKDRLLGDPVVADLVKASHAATRPEPSANVPHVFANQAGQRFTQFIHPLAPYSLRGVVWYQGEANACMAATSKPYGHLLALMVRSWRDAWNAPNLPFYYVQLPSIADPDRTYYLVREQMLQTLGKLPRLGMAVCIDLNEGLHPRSKHIVGDRLARIALRDTYGLAVTAYGPVFRSATFVDGQTVCRFAEADGGLLVKDGPDGAFELAGEDRVFHPAQATVKGNTVVVGTPDVPAPVAVRYAWANAVPNPTLANAEGLPASPFRSDDW